MKVYFASHTDNAHAILAQETILWEHNHRLCCSWPEMVINGFGEQPFKARAFWQLDMQEVRDADVVVVFALTDAPLRGALVEAGMAIAFETPVVVVGDHPSYGTWQYHPAVYRIPHLDDLPGFLDVLERVSG